MNVDPADDSEFSDVVGDAVAAVEEAHPDASLPANEPAVEMLVKVTADPSAEIDLRRDTARILGLLAEQFPEELEPVVPDLVAVVADSGADGDGGIADSASPDADGDGTAETVDESIQRHVLLALGYVSEAVPTALRPGRDALVSLLSGNAGERTRYAAWILSNVAEADPEAVEPAVPYFVEYVDHDDRDCRRHAIRAVGHVAETYPEAVRPIVPTLTDALDSQSLYRTVGRTLVSVASIAPESVVDDVVGQIGPGNRVRREHASWTLVLLAEDHADAVWSNWPELLDILEDDDDYQVQNNVAATVAALAKERPDSELVTELIDLLDHPDMFIRRYVCLALGDVAVSAPRTPAIEALDAARNDEAQVVSAEAEEALTTVANTHPDVISDVDVDVETPSSADESDH